MKSPEYASCRPEEDKLMPPRKSLEDLKKNPLVLDGEKKSRERFDKCYRIFELITKILGDDIPVVKFEALALKLMDVPDEQIEDEIWRLTTEEFPSGS